MGDSSPFFEKDEEKINPLGIQIQHIPMEITHNCTTNSSELDKEFPAVEHQFIPSFLGQSPLNKNHQQDQVPVQENLSALRNICDEDITVSLQLGDNEAKRRRTDPSTSNLEGFENGPKS